MERKLSKKMPSNSRPPLTSRIRASFDGKRTKSEVTSPTIGTNGFITQQPDPDLLQKAVDHAMNSEAFQDAISANLAKLLKPTIKSALDTIQPVVETVYNHEVLLRQTNKSVENLLERLDTVSEAPESEFGDPQTPTPATPRRRALNISSSPPNIEVFKQLLEENNAQTFSKLSELSGSVEASNIKIAEAVDGIRDINTVLYPTRECLDSVKSISEQSNNATSVIQAQLGQLSKDVGTILDAIWKDLSRKNKGPDTTLFSEHTSRLDEISSSLASLKSPIDNTQLLQSISENIEIVKDNVQQGGALSKDNFAEIRPQFDRMLASGEAQLAHLVELKAVVDPCAEILDAVNKSNISHTSHAAVLSRIEEKNGTSGNEYAAVSSRADPETSETLKALKADLTSLKENIVTGLATSHDDIAGLGTKVEDVLVTLEAHRASDLGGDILAEVKRSNDSHASHASAIDGIRSIDFAARSSENVESASSLEPNIATIISTLESHTATLDSILASVPQSNSGALDTIENNIKEMASLLEANSTALNEIKDDVSAEILTILNDHSSMLSEIKESDVSEEILTSINDGYATQTTAMADLQASVHALDSTHASHEKASEELSTTTAIEPSPNTAAARDSPELEAQLNAIMTTLEEQNAVLSAIKEAAVASIDSLGGHAAALAEIKEATHSAKSFQEAHDTTLAELKGALNTSVDSHASHSKALAELKDASLAANNLHASHITSLSEIRSIQPAAGENNVDLGSFQASFDSILSSLDVQTTTLLELKDAAGNAETLTIVKESQELLQSQSSVLKSIKDSDSHDDILANISSLKSIIEESRAEFGDHSASVKNLQESTKASYSDIAQAIAALAAGGAAEAGVGALVSSDDDHSLELLEGVNFIRATIERSSGSIEALREITSSTAAQIETNHTTITTRITTMSDEIKSEIDATGTEITDSLATINGDVKNIDSTLIDTIVPNVLRSSAAINENGTEIKSISSSLNGLHGTVQDTGDRIINLKMEGLHLNDNGVGQLKEHALLSGTRSMSAQRSNDKGTWWKEHETGGVNASTLVSQGDEDSLGMVEEPNAIRKNSVGLESVDEAASVEKGDLEEIKSQETAEAPLLVDSKQPDETSVETDLPVVNIQATEDEQQRDTKKLITDETQSLPAAEEEEQKDETNLVAEETQFLPAAEQESIPALVTGPEAEESINSRADEDHDKQHSPIADALHADVVEDVQPAEFPTAKDGTPKPEEPHLPPPSPISPARAENSLDSPKSAIFSPVEALEPSPTLESEPLDEPLTSPVFSEADAESASTSAIASPMSPSFPEKSAKGGKKGKKEKKEKKGKKDKKAPFVFDPDEEEGAAA